MRIWTSFGYKFADDLYIGQRTISFNPDRGVCEYDTIQQVQTEYKRCMGYGLYSKSMRQVLTPDHDLLYWNSALKKLNRISIEDKFMHQMVKGRPISVISHALFEPYKRTQSEEDIKWSARMAATIANHPRAKLYVGSILSDLGGYEAQVWLDEFVHWNRMVPGKNWMASVKLRNREIRDIIFDIAPRAGVGAKWQYNRKTPIMSITEDGDVFPSSVSWFKRPIDGIVFNLTTKNGNVLAKGTHGTSLIACKKGE